MCRLPSIQLAEEGGASQILACGSSKKKLSTTANLPPFFVSKMRQDSATLFSRERRQCQRSKSATECCQMNCLNMFSEPGAKRTRQCEEALLTWPLRGSRRSRLFGAHGKPSAVQGPAITAACRRQSRRWIDLTKAALSRSILKPMNPDHLCK